jgi:Arc/MetJ-type ribon-helix-helix transcriptional regulator
MRYSITIICLSKYMDKFIHDAVRAGLYMREDDVIRAALIRLQQTMPRSSPATPGKQAKRARPPRQKKPLTIDELHKQMLASGLISQLPDTDADFDDPADESITSKGEPLSETIIRARR